jgi:hypothetical protein
MPSNTFQRCAPCCAIVRICCIALIGLSAALGMVGCGSRGTTTGRPEIDNVPEIEHRGGAAKNMIYEFRAKVRKRGVAAAKTDLPDVLASMEGYQRLKLGEHNATFKEIYDKLKALEGTLAGSPSKEDVQKAVDEIATIAAKLPGKANENPVVE